MAMQSIPTGVTLNPVNTTGGQMVQGSVDLNPSSTQSQTVELATNRPDLIPHLANSIPVPPNTTVVHFALLPVPVAVVTIVTIIVTCNRQNPFQVTLTLRPGTGGHPPAT
jgi:hypothetical protein